MFSCEVWNVICGAVCQRRDNVAYLHWCCAAVWWWRCDCVWSEREFQKLMHEAWGRYMRAGCEGECAFATNRAGDGGTTNGRRASKLASVCLSKDSKFRFHSGSYCMIPVKRTRQQIQTNPTKEPHQLHANSKRSAHLRNVTVAKVFGAKMSSRTFRECLTNAKS